MPPELFLLSDWPTTGQRVELQRYQQHATRNKMHFDTTTQHNTARNSTVQYSTRRLAIALVCQRSIEGLKRTHAFVDKSRLIPVLWSVK